MQTVRQPRKRRTCNWVEFIRWWKRCGDRDVKPTYELYKACSLQDRRMIKQITELWKLEEEGNEDDN